ncbi:MAG: TonB-dependent receptor [Bacteroidota bacterium]
MKQLILLILLLLGSFQLSAQSYTQDVKGRITDVQSQQSIGDAIIEIVEGERVLATTKSDSNGYFLIQNVAIGRISVKVSRIGYADYSVNNLIHVSGKQTVLEIELSEKLAEIKGFAVSAKKNGVNNDNISLSAKSFNIEDTRRYAGSRNDPARMASNFAGVVGNNDSRNDIIIRGNSPQGLLWRMEGIDIPNPNHFGSMGASGGPVGILNNNVLAKSDFMTSAFPAMYGNATAGVFDLQMRSGNKTKNEFMGQIGFNGFEAGIEGPFSKKSKASYLMNYRFSTLAILQKMGLNFGTGTAIPYYQDMSLKIDIPLKKNKLTFFGIGGFSNIHFSDENSNDSSNLYANSNRDLKYSTRMGVLGASYTHYFTKQLFLKTVIGSTYSGVSTVQDSVWAGGRKPEYRDNSGLAKHLLISTLNYKRSSRHFYTLGINVQNIRFNFRDSLYYDNRFHTLRNDKGQTNLVQSFVTWQYKITEATTLNTGLHYQHLLLNNSQMVEPRLGLTHQLTKKKKISIATGLHSQMQSMQMYYLKTEVNGTKYETNHSLDFTKSIHSVIAYDYAMSRKWRLKTEAYYQYLYDVPVTSYSSYYSAINEGADFNNPNTDSLVNNGTGQNKGIEFTLEKSFNKGFYMLNTLSLYDSKYKGSNGIERSTAYNSHYILNVLAGKEMSFGKKSVLAFDTKVTLAGGKRYTPIDLNRSQLEKRRVSIDAETFEKQFDPYFRLDFKVTYRRSGKRITQEWFVDIQNITNRKNIFIQGYDVTRGKITTQYQLGLFPNFNYRINF